MRKAVKEEPSRHYDATGRRIAAEGTRRRILQAANKLFLDRGYAATTMVAIAADADVSVETIYLSVGCKAALARYLIETALSGTDRPVPALERPVVQEIQAESDAHRKVQMFARVVRELQERLAPIWDVVREAARADAGLASLITELKERHIGNMRLFVEHLASVGALRADLSAELAADVVWATNSPEFYRLLVVERGWSGETFESYLADAWQRLLL